MSKPAPELFAGLQSRVIRLDRTRARVERLFSEKKLIRFDVEQIYSGIYLDAFVSLERFIEDLFVGYLTGQIAPHTMQVAPLVSFKTRPLTKNVLKAGKAYIDWIPYSNNTEVRAKVFFKEGYPFTTLSKQQKNSIEQLHRIRNALAHRSDHSYDLFARHVVGALPLSPHERKPAGFLRSNFRANPPQTRLENYLFEVLAIALHLSHG